MINLRSLSNQLFGNPCYELIYNYFEIICVYFLNWMAEPPVLYGIGTMDEIRKKMTGKYIIKQTDLPTEMRAELADAIQTGIESYAAQPNVIEVRICPHTARHKIYKGVPG